MDIIERLQDPEMYVDAIDDAIAEIEQLRTIVFLVEHDSKVQGYLTIGTVNKIIEYCVEHEQAGTK